MRCPLELRGGCSANGAARLSNPLGDGPGRPHVWLFIACDGPKGSEPGSIAELVAITGASSGKRLQEIR
jgi:hypothetical protein